MARQQVRGVGQQEIQGAAQISQVRGGNYTANNDPEILRFAQQILGTGQDVAKAMTVQRGVEASKIQEAMQSFATNNPEKMDELVSAGTPEARQALMKTWREAGIMPPSDDPAAARQLDAEIGLRLHGTVKSRLLEARANGDHLSRVDPENPDKIITGKSTSRLIEEIQQEYAEAYEALGEDGRSFYGKSLSDTESRFTEALHQERLESELKIHQDILSDALMSSVDTATISDLISATVMAYGPKGEAMAMQAVSDAAAGIEATEGPEAAQDFLLDTLGTSPVNKDTLGRSAAWGSALGPMLNRLESRIDIEQERTFSKMHSSAKVLGTEVLEGLDTDGMTAEELSDAVAAAVSKMDTSAAGGEKAVIAATLGLYNDRMANRQVMKERGVEAKSSERLDGMLTKIQATMDAESLTRQQDYYNRVDGKLPGLTDKDSLAVGKALEARIDTLNSTPTWKKSGFSQVEKNRRTVLALPKTNQAEGKAIVRNMENAINALERELSEDDGFQAVTAIAGAAEEALSALQTQIDEQIAVVTKEFADTGDLGLLENYPDSQQAQIVDKAAVMRNADTNRISQVTNSPGVQTVVRGIAIDMNRELESSPGYDMDMAKTLPGAITAAATQVFIEKHPTISSRNLSSSQTAQIMSDIIRDLKPEDLFDINASLTLSVETQTRRNPGVPPYSQASLAFTEAGKASNEMFKGFSDWSSPSPLRLGGVWLRGAAMEHWQLERVRDGLLSVVTEGPSATPTKQWLFGRHHAATAVLGGDVKKGTSDYRLVLSTGSAGAEQQEELLAYAKAAGVTSGDLQSIKEGKGLTFPYFYVVDPTKSYTQLDEGAITIEAEGITLDTVPYIPDTLGLEKTFWLGVETTNDMMKNFEGELRAVLASNPELVGNSDVETVVSRQKTWLTTRISNMDI